MTFDELFNQACDLANLPEMARIQLPNVLSAETKKMVMCLSPKQFGEMLKDAIHKVDHGSVEPIDKLIKSAFGR